LLDFCRGRLARYKTPKQVVFTEALPYSPYGKVIKAELREKYTPRLTEPATGGGS
jgi:acyl-CoA synthetase (AMP-forming)/AMP-acid ligase II